jgi:hypothetical protein
MIAQMIEPIMYFAIGFLLAALSVLVVTPLVHGRAVRLTMRRLEATMPLSMAEVQADKDLQRAEFAMSTRRLETTVEQLRTRGAGQLAELGRKGDAINRLKIELGTLRDQLRATEDEFAVKIRAALDAQRSLSEKAFADLKSELDERSSIDNVQKVEIIALKGQVEALKGRLTGASQKLKTEGGFASLAPTVPIQSSQSPPLIDRRHEDDTVPLVPTVPMDSSQSLPPNNQRHERDVLHSISKDWPTAELPKAPMNSSQNPSANSRRHEGDGLHFVPKDWPTAELPKAPINSSQNPSTNSRRHEGDGLHFVPKDWPTAELPKAPTDSSQSPRHERDGLHFVPKDWPAAELPKAPMNSSQNPPTNSQRPEGDVLPFVPKDCLTVEVRSDGPARDPDATRDASDRRIGIARAGSDFSTGLLSVEPSIRVAPRRSGIKNQFASERPSIGRRTLRTLAACFIAAVIGVGGSSAWRSHADKTMEIVRNWTPSLGWLASISTKSPPAPAPAVAAASPELAHQLEAMPRDLVVVRRSLEQLAEKQEQMARNIAALRSFEHDIKKKASSPHLQSRTKPTPWPETRPTTIAGWTLRGITNGTAVLEGPNGTWSAMQGDTVPGVGRVESMVRWGGRLIVATSGGLISTP